MVDLKLAVLNLVELYSLIDVWHSVAQHVEASQEEVAGRPQGPAEPGCASDLLAAIQRTWINRVRCVRHVVQKHSAMPGEPRNLCHSVFRARGSPGLAWNRPSVDPRVPVTLVRSCPPTRPCPGILDRAILMLSHRACPGVRLGICCRFMNLTALRVFAVPRTPAAARVNRNMRKARRETPIAGLEPRRERS